MDATAIVAAAMDAIESGTAASAAPKRVLSVAELAECVCPEPCLRDHDNE